MLKKKIAVRVRGCRFDKQATEVTQVPDADKTSTAPSENTIASHAKVDHTMKSVPESLCANTALIQTHPASGLSPPNDASKSGPHATSNDRLFEAVAWIPTINLRLSWLTVS